ncbi:MAG TPA: lipoprotein insertase outer membrane protein LolB [Pseudidiomarina sp.]|nr:lipoprotein insertase outer membrane protein LolB [Pseudidiomarina sp.]
MRKLWISTCVLLLAACSSVPDGEKIDSIQPIDRAAYERHQQLLVTKNSWRLQGQLALFNLRDDSRDAVYLDWSWTPDETAMRFSHPLRGTLATIEQTATGALLIDDEQNEYRAPTIAALLTTYFGVRLPIDSLPTVVRGILPRQAVAVEFMHPVQDSSTVVLASYEVNAEGQQWRANLANYSAFESIYVPKNIELTAADWRIKLRINEWFL